MDLAAGIATVCCGVFAGAAVYISLVEHPARMERGAALAERPADAGRILARWARLHAVRSVVSIVALVVFVLANLQR